MSQDGTRAGRGRGSAPPGGRGGSSVYSVGTSMRKNRNTIREEMIAKKITEIFKEKENRMIRTIEQTITEDRLRVYKQKRSEYELEFQELDAERRKILKKKKSKKERTKLLKANTKAQFCLIVRALNATVLHYKEMYYENDYYRYKKLLDVQAEKSDMDEKQKNRALLDQLNQFFASPFKDDRRFTIFHLAQLTRDRIDQSKELINALFFDKIFRLLLNTNDERNKLKAFEILCNLIHSPNHRKRLAQQGYFKQVYDTMKIGSVDEKTLEKLSWMTTLICFHPDMIDQIIHLRLLAFIIRLVDPKFAPAIRSNAVLAISLLTYHESLFDELIANGVIDLVMNLCMDVGGDLQVKQFSTLALVHFALSKQSINILIQKGIMDLFNSLGIIENVQIQTNVSWIFLALCNNGITGKQMLINGITRDMFLVSCNPQFHQIRHLVIAGFAELGRCTELRDAHDRHKGGSLQRIKEKAIVGMHACFKEDALTTIDILLKFTISTRLQFVITSFWALKDYILLNHDCLIKDLSGVIWAFVNGSAEESELVKIECANAISFLITHHLVFNKEQADHIKQNQGADADKPYLYNESQNYVLDALMLLTASESLQVRTRAFSTLSTLSTYASQDEYVMSQIQADIAMEQQKASKDYFDFIHDRLSKSHEAFTVRYKTDDIESMSAGLYCLLRLAQEPNEDAAQEAAAYLHKFYYPAHYLREEEDKIEASNKSKTQDQEIEVDEAEDTQLSKKQKQRLSVFLDRDDDALNDIEGVKLDTLNEKFFMFVFESLLHTRNQRIMYQLLDIVNFYIKNGTEYQSKVINASIILWMLEILCRYKDDQDLSLLAAKTILRVVENHQIIFDYQEMAIIKKFNMALDNTEHQTAEDGDEEAKEAMSDSAGEGGSQQSDEEKLMHESQHKHAGQSESFNQDIKNQARRQLEAQVDKQFDAESIDRRRAQDNNSDYLPRACSGDGSQIEQKGNLKAKSELGSEDGAANGGQGAVKIKRKQPNQDASQQNHLDQSSLVLKDELSCENVKGSYNEAIKSDEQSDPYLLAVNKNLTQSQSKHYGSDGRSSQALIKTEKSFAEPMQMEGNEISLVEIADESKVIDRRVAHSYIEENQLDIKLQITDSTNHLRDQIGGASVSRDQIYHQSHRSQADLVQHQKKDLKIADPATLASPKKAYSHAKGTPNDGTMLLQTQVMEELENSQEMRGDYQEADMNSQQRYASKLSNSKKGQVPSKTQNKSEDQYSVSKCSVLAPTNSSQNNALRDALIKSFMVIFTNEKSQHLLLNKDIIEIAFNCLEFCESISVEAKRNLARLISIIFKFPQVQERILQPKIINGVVHLLDQDTSQKSILSHAVRSCTYISLSYSFVNSSLSLNLLKALIPLMDILESDVNTDHLKKSNTPNKGREAVNETEISSEQNTKAEWRSDRDNCLFSISNILKGNSTNAHYFISCDAPRKVMQGLLLLLDSSNAAQKKHVIELCVNSVKQLANTKQSFKQFLEFSEENRVLLPGVIKRVFLISDDWHTSTRELLRFNKIFNANEAKPQTQRLQTQEILQLDHENVENFKALELLEKQEDMSIRMAPVVRIRNCALYIALGCFRSRFCTEFLIDECGLIERLISDLERDSINDYLFQHLMLLLQSLQKDQRAVEHLILDYHERIFNLFNQVKSGEKKITLIKTIVQLVIRIPEQIHDRNAAIFGRLFQLALQADVPNQSDRDEITESILWLQSTMMQLQEEGPQLQKSIQLCLSLKSAEIFVQCLSNSNERIVLQALQGLSTMASLAEFRPTLLIDLGDRLFGALAKILNSRDQAFKQLSLEIETELCNLLAKVTSSKQASKDPLTVAARRRIVQQGFVEGLMQRAIIHGYKVCDETTAMNDQLNATGFADLSMSMPLGDQEITQLMCSSELSALLENNNSYDDLDRCPNGNQFVEHILLLLAHVTELAENHTILLCEGCPLISLVITLCDQFVAYSDEGLAANQIIGQDASGGRSTQRQGQPIEMTELSYGNLKAGKNISRILCNLCSEDQSQITCLEHGLASCCVQLLQHLVDFELQVHLGKALSALVLAKDKPLGMLATDQGCLQSLITLNDDSRFFKVKRICQAAIDSASNEQHEANDRQQKRQQRINRTRKSNNKLAV